MELSLEPHHCCRPQAAERIDWFVGRSDIGFTFEFQLYGDLASIVVPPAKSQDRRDDLWLTTCFEVFLQPVGTNSYYEINVAPSGEWAAYRFQRYRQGRPDPRIFPDGNIMVGEENGGLIVYGKFEADDIPELYNEIRLGVSAVVEEKDGTKSYWALAHPAGDKPDFHDAVCFAARLA